MDEVYPVPEVDEDKEPPRTSRRRAAPEPETAPEPEAPKAGRRRAEPEKAKDDGLVVCPECNQRVTPSRFGRCPECAFVIKRKDEDVPF